MAFDSWRAFYQSDLQSLYALVPVPALFLLALLATAPRMAAWTPTARFVHLYALCFTAQTLADLLATGPLTRALQLSEAAATAVMFLFVLLGDFRVFALVFSLATGGWPRPGRGLREAAVWTAIVPVCAGAPYFLVDRWVADLPGQVLWLLYELGFLTLALVLRSRVIPARLGADVAGLSRFLRAALAYVATYYGLWATADALILFADLDAGWLLRVLPNQLYYAFWTPFVYASFRALR